MDDLSWLLPGGGAVGGMGALYVAMRAAFKSAFNGLHGDMEAVRKSAAAIDADVKTLRHEVHERFDKIGDRISTNERKIAVLEATTSHN